MHTFVCFNWNSVKFKRKIVLIKLISLGNKGIKKLTYTKKKTLANFHYFR